MDPTDASTPIPARRSAGTIAGFRQPLPWSPSKPFRILSIDGGGIKGIFPASVLSAFERRLCGGRSAGDYFDLIAGTSTGGIIALGLGLGLPATAILKLYLDHGAAIFPPMTGLFGPLRRRAQAAFRFGRYSYETAPLESALYETFGDRQLGHAQRRLCIPSFEGTFSEVHIFKTPHHPDFRLDWKEPMVEVALATAAAPSFFKVFKSRGRVFADGGVWANNPVMIALVDAISSNDIDRRQVEILSISCGDTDIPFTRGQIAAGGMLHWRDIIGSAMHLASQNATGQAGLLVGRDHLLRISPSDAASCLKMDDYLAAAASLPGEGEKAAEAHLDAVRRFFQTPADPAPAFHGPRT